MIIYSKDEIDNIINELNTGKTVAFGTDTVFGLGCVYGNQEAVNKIYKVKNRDKSKKLPMMFSDISMMKKYVEINESSEKIINRFAPGPITFILKSINDNDTIACRIPDDKWIIDLIKKIKKPLYVTSANISGETSLYKYEEVKNVLTDTDVVVKKDATGNQASTIVDMINNYKILRSGPIKEEDIRKLLYEDTL